MVQDAVITAAHLEAVMHGWMSPFQMTMRDVHGHLISWKDVQMWHRTIVFTVWDETTALQDCGVVRSLELT